MRTARQVEASRSANKLPTSTSSARPGAYELPLDFLTDPPSKALSS
jgi:hypothetical protein